MPKHEATLGEGPPVLGGDDAEQMIEAALQKGRQVEAEQKEKATEAIAKPVDRIHHFKIDMFSRWEGERVRGAFSTTILSNRMMIRVGVIKSQLLAAAAGSVDYFTTQMAEKMAHLEVCLIDKPKWFEPLTCEDREVLDSVYEEVASHEARFWGQGREGATPGAPDESEEPTSEAPDAD